MDGIQEGWEGCEFWLVCKGKAKGRSGGSKGAP